MKKKICVCTGTRAEYGILKPILLEINKNKKLELQLVVTGMHLLKRFGNTVNEIEKDGIKIDSKVAILVDRDSGKAMAKSIGKGIIAFSKCFKEIKPDIVVLLGDRMESFVAAVAAGCMNLPIAHIHGGDLTEGGLDEVFRPCISKFASIHFPATEKSAERIKKIGEEQWRIHVVGAPGLDSIYAKQFPGKKETCKKLNLNIKKPIVMVIQHSITTETKKAAEQVMETMEAVKELGQQTVVIYPNSDAGGRKIIKVIECYRKLPFIKIFKNLSHNEFLGLMNCAGAMVGNSSSGIIETPSFGLPTVNIGTRQKDRERSTNIIDVSYDKEQIKKAIQKALFNKKFIEKVKKCKSPYGNGTACKKITKILEKIEINTKLLQKKSYACAKSD